MRMEDSDEKKLSEREKCEKHRSLHVLLESVLGDDNSDVVKMVRKGILLL